MRLLECLRRPGALGTEEHSMVHAGHIASTAGAAVGYESASPFGLEFKRFFGASPAEEAALLRARLSAGGAEVQPVRA